MADAAIQQKQFLSDKVERFTESVIREMTRQAMLYGAVNLAQGFPDFPAPADIKRAAQEAVANDINQYAITWGARNLRQAIARQTEVWQGISADPETEITVCCGSTECMISTLLAVCNAGDEVVIFEPFYENYEHILYDGTKHISIASLEGMRERTVTINGLSKTYSVTGWRVGWTIAPLAITNAIRKVHDFLTVGAPAPLQEAGAAALGLASEYYQKLADGYRARRDRLMPALAEAGFKCFRPRGAYYVMTDISGFGFADDLAFP